MNGFAVNLTTGKFPRLCFYFSPLFLATSPTTSPLTDMYHILLPSFLPSFLLLFFTSIYPPLDLDLSRPQHSIFPLANATRYFLICRFRSSYYHNLLLLPLLLLLLLLMMIVGYPSSSTLSL